MFDPESHSRPRSSHGTLVRESILPVSCTFRYGIGGTRFLSEFDIVITAYAHRMGLDPFPDKPLTPKEERMVRGKAFQLGLLVQYGGFLGKQKCLAIKRSPFSQCTDFTTSDIRTIIALTKFDYASLWGNSKTIVKTDKLRIDIQDPAPEHQNLQIQVNKKRSHKPGQPPPSTTCSTILLSFALAIFETAAQKKHVMRKVKNAFLLSAQTGQKYEVTLGEVAP